MAEYTLAFEKDVVTWIPLSMKISFERNIEQNNDTIPYFLHIETRASELDWGRQYRVPVILSHGLFYVVEICGVRIEAETFRELVPKVQSQLLALENMSRMPTYVFITRRSRKLFPVYTVGDHVVAVTPQGVSFKHVELAKVREYLTDYLHQVGLLGPLDRGDKLHVRGVHKETLALNRPVFYLKKKAVQKKENEFWAPVFQSRTSNVIYAYAANTRHETELDEGQEVFELRHKVAEALIADNRLGNNYNLRADRLMPDLWEKVRSNLKKLPGDIVYDGIKLPMYLRNGLTVALEYRSKEDRYSLYLGANDEDLLHRVGQDLVRRELISDETAVYIRRSS